MPTIPHLSLLQKTFAKKGLVVIGVSTENAAEINAFTAKQKDMEYSVAADDNQKTYTEYMKGQEGIPLAFLIDRDGRIAWIGHPLIMENVLEQVLEGKYDLNKNIELSKLMKKLNVELEQQNVNGALKIIDKILAINPGNIQVASMKIYIFFKKNEKDKALAMTEEQIKKHPDVFGFYSMKIRILKSMNKEQEISRTYDQIINNLSDKTEALNVLVKELIHPKNGVVQLANALKVAEGTYFKGKFTKDINRATAADNLARCYYLIGRADKAVEMELNVIPLVKNDPKKLEQAKIILDYYKTALHLGKKIK